MIGQTISHYKIIEKLGEGGMGVVYKAEDIKLRRNVAIKFLPRNLSASSEERARFALEAQAASALNHPNIATIYEIDSADDETFIVMEYVEGVTLREKAKGMGMKAGEAMGYAVQIAEGLAAAHEKGIVHRDIKADNIMVRNDGRVQIMDFGLAKLQGISALTKAGSTIGTTGYMSPEQVQGLETDHRTDIFAFGVVMYEMLTGQLPFKGSHEAAVMYEIVNVAAPRISAMRSDIDSEFERIVGKCLEKDRENRYQTAREIVVDLKRFRRDSDGSRGGASSMNAAPVVQPKRRVVMLVAVAAIVVIVAVGGYLLLGRGETIDSLAVLPFENVGADPNMEYLSDGITESIINGLSKLPGLRVVPRSTVFRLRGKDLDPQDAGKKLNVRGVLSGKIIQRGQELDVQVDLIDVRNESQLWGQRYRRSTADMLALQSEITAEVSERLKLHLTGETKKQLSKRSTESTEAYQLYLQGRYFWNKRNAPGLEKAIDFFKRAIAIDPAYALAYSGLADCYVLQEQYSSLPGRETFPRAEASANRALELDNSLAEAHTSLAFVRTYYYDWAGAEKEYKTAISLNPNYPTAYHWYSIDLHHLGRSEEAFAIIKRGQELDPLSPVIVLNVGQAYMFQKNYDEAIKVFNRVIELDPSFAKAYAFLGHTYTKKGMFKEALPYFEKAVEFSGRSAENLGDLGYYQSRWGDKREAAKILKELESRYAEGKASAFNVAVVYTGFDDRDKIFEWLEKDYRDHTGWLQWLPNDGQFDAVRSDPRFADLLKRIGLGR